MADQTNPDNPQSQQPTGAKPALQQHELVNKLAPEPSQLQPLTVLSGFPGRSPQTGYWRLYLTPTLDEYVEIPEGDIVHSQAPEPGQSATAATMIWVRSEAPLQYTRTTSRSIQAEFLQGPITTGFKARATGFSAGMAPRSDLAAFTHNAYCASNGGYCLSDACESDVAKYCPTKWSCGLTNECGGSGVECGLSDTCRTVPGCPSNVC